MADTSTKKRARGAAFTELGRTGLRHSAGHLSEEFLFQLRGLTGIRTYREMSENDAIVGACLFAIRQILREARWSVKTADEESADCKKDAEFLESNMRDLKTSWVDFITEVLSMLSYGWSWFEIVYKIRKIDNMIGWKKFGIRSQNSFSRWKMKDNGSVEGYYQRPAPTYQELYIPLDKSLLFRPSLNYDNPEGRSILRNAYRPWYFKKNIEEIEGIGIERDLTGLPQLKLPEGVNPDDDDEDTKATISSAKQMLMNVRKDAQSGVLLPFGWEFDLVSSPGTHQLDTTSIINRYNKEIAVTVLAQFVMLGMERTGSYALAREQTDMFYLCLEGWMDSIASVLNRYAVPTLFKLNGVTNRPYPEIVHTAIRRYNLKDLATYVSTLCNVEGLIIDDDIRDFLKRYARLQTYSDAKS